MERDESSEASTGDTPVVPSLPDAIKSIPVQWDITMLPEPYNNPEIWQYRTNQTILPEPEAWKTIIIQGHKNIPQNIITTLCHQHPSLAGPLEIEGRITNTFHQHVDKRLINAVKEMTHPPQHQNNFKSSCGRNSEMGVVTTAFTILASITSTRTALQHAYKHPNPAGRQLATAAARLNTSMPINEFGIWYIYTKGPDHKQWTTWQEAITRMWELTTRIIPEIQHRDYLTDPKRQKNHTQAWLTKLERNEVTSKGLVIAIKQKIWPTDRTVPTPQIIIHIEPTIWPKEGIPKLVTGKDGTKYGLRWVGGTGGNRTGPMESKWLHPKETQVSQVNTQIAYLHSLLYVAEEKTAAQDTKRLNRTLGSPWATSTPTETILTPIQCAAQHDTRPNTVEGTWMCAVCHTLQDCIFKENVPQWYCSGPCQHTICNDCTLLNREEGTHPSLKVWTHWDIDDTKGSTWRVLRWAGGSMMTLSAPRQQEGEEIEEQCLNQKTKETMDKTSKELLTMAEQIRTPAAPRPKRRRTLRDR
eukprot:gene4891-2630_t